MTTKKKRFHYPGSEDALLDGCICSAKENSWGVGKMNENYVREYVVDPLCEQHNRLILEVVYTLGT